MRLQSPAEAGRGKAIMCRCGSRSRPLVELLEKRRLLSAVPHAVVGNTLISLVGQYAGTSHVRFFTASEPHTPRLGEPVSLAIATETDGSIAGTFGLGGAGAEHVRGTVQNTRLVLTFADEPGDAGFVGTVTARLGRKGTVLTGSVDGDRPVNGVHESGSFTMRRVVPTAPQPPGVDLVGQYTGTLHGLYFPPPDAGSTPQRYSTAASLSISSQNPAGAILGQLGDVPFGLAGQVAGAVSGRTLAIELKQFSPQSIVLRASRTGRLLTGRFLIELDPGLIRLSGVLRLRRLQ